MCAALTGIGLRPAVPDDVDRIAAFNRAMATETEGKTLDPDTVHRGVAALLADPSRGRYVLACADGTPVGQIMWTYEWSDWRNGVFWWIQSVYVDPAWRRRGVFGLLFDEVRRRAAASPDACGLRLYVDRDNDVARRTYAALGGALTGYALMEWPLTPSG